METKHKRQERDDRDAFHIADLDCYSVQRDARIAARTCANRSVSAADVVGESDVDRSSDSEDQAVDSAVEESDASASDHDDDASAADDVPIAPSHPAEGSSNGADEDRSSNDGGHGGDDTHGGDGGNGDDDDGDDDDDDNDDDDGDDDEDSDDNVGEDHDHGFRLLAVGDQTHVAIKRVPVTATVVRLHPEDRTVTVSYRWKKNKAIWHERLLEEQLGFFVTNFDNANAPDTAPDAAVSSDSDDSAKPPPKRRRTNPRTNLLTAATPPPDSARARRVTEAAARKAAAAQAEAALEQLDCSDEQEIIDLAKAISLSATEAAATAPRTSIHGVPAIGHLLSTPSLTSRTTMLTTVTTTVRTTMFMVATTAAMVRTAMVTTKTMAPMPIPLATRPNAVGGKTIAPVPALPATRPQLLRPQQRRPSTASRISCVAEGF